MVSSLRVATGPLASAVTVATPAPTMPVPPVPRSFLRNQTSPLPGAYSMTFVPPSANWPPPPFASSVASNGIHSRVQPVEYGEIVATIASKSAGPGTRANIDEFTETTAKAVEVIGGAKRGKAIIILNPAEPPLIMRDTVHCLTESEPDQAAIGASIAAMMAEVQKYVPGYQLKNGPVFDGRRVSVWLEVAGLGDYLP